MVEVYEDQVFLDAKTYFTKIGTANQEKLAVAKEI